MVAKGIDSYKWLGLAALRAHRLGAANAPRVHRKLTLFMV